MDLTSVEAKRIKDAYLTGSAKTFEEISDEAARQKWPAMDRFWKAWAKLNIEERSEIQFELARMISPNEGDVGTDELKLAVDPHDLDIGIAILRVRNTGEQAKRGPKVRAPGFREAVDEAVAIWSDRGNKRIVGNIHRDSSRYTPNPMLKFVIDALTSVLPPEVFQKATLAPSPSQQEIMSAVDSQLRA